MNPRIPLFCAALTYSGSTNACMTFEPGANRLASQFRGQRDLIVWDEARHKEHFIRYAKFKGDGGVVDFVAPTPSIPTIAEVDENTFNLLANITRSWVNSIGGSAGGMAGGGGGGGGVIVERESVIGGYRATTLRASSTSDLQQWLQQNSYQISPDRREWLEFYVRKGWFLTAFRLESKSAEFAASAIRMTFATTQPFCPYYVPKSNWGSGAALEVFFVGSQQYTGRIGEFSRRPWAGKAVFNEALRPEESRKIAKAIKISGNEMPQDAIISRFVDNSFARGATDDLFFSEVRR
ncbi:MAG: DUF2330 domain-containing protein [Armatimonadota bacterium]